MTPYLASRYLVDQMDLPAAARARVLLRNYTGGHMFYLHAASLEALHETAAAFFAGLTDQVAARRRRRLISRCLGLAFPDDWAQHRTGA